MLCTDYFQSSQKDTTIRNIIYAVMFLFYAAIYFAKSIFKKEYVSEIYLNDNTIDLIYKIGKNQRKEVIEHDEIEKFEAIIVSTMVTGHKGSQHEKIRTKVNIYKKNSELISFTAKRNENFLKDLIRYSNKIPNFHYNTDNASEWIKEEIKYFAMTGKTLPFLKKEFLRDRNLCLLVVALIFMAISAVAFSTCTYYPAQHNSKQEEKLYISYIDKGYTLYQKKEYQKSMEYYDNAQIYHSEDQALYYYKAINSFAAKDYNAAIEYSYMGIECLGKKSPYYKAKKYKPKDLEIKLYTILADSYYSLGKYSQALKAYQHIQTIDNNKYTNIYMKLGTCQYYLDNKQEALLNFNNHLQIVQSYINETNKNKPKHPLYTNNDIVNTNKLIKNCK